MATSTTKNTLIETNERFAEVGRKLTSAYLDGVEKYAESFADFERKLGHQTHVEPVASMFDTHAQLTEEVVRASVSAARDLIRA